MHAAELLEFSNILCFLLAVEFRKDSLFIFLFVLFEELLIDALCLDLTPDPLPFLFVSNEVA